MQRMDYAANQANQNTNQCDGSAFEYLESPKQECICLLCLSNLKDAYEIETCGHMICKSCLFKMKEE